MNCVTPYIDHFTSKRHSFFISWVTPNRTFLWIWSNDTKHVAAFYKWQRRGDYCWLSSAHTALILSSLILSLLVGIILVFLRVSVPFPASLFLFFLSLRSYTRVSKTKKISRISTLSPTPQSEKTRQMSSVVLEPASFQQFSPISLRFHIQWSHAGSLKLATVELFTLWKLANATNFSFLPHSPEAGCWTFTSTPLDTEAK